MICASLGSLSFEECKKALSIAEYAEIRIDLLDLSDDQFRMLFSSKQKTIATCRADNYNDTQRLQKLKSAITSGVGFIDVEFESDELFREQLINFAHSHNVKVIISYHNYESTPDKNALEQIIQQSFKWGADYAKLATMATSSADNSRILGLYENNENLIAFCMGEKGAITRLAAPLLGSLFTYAALKAELAVAPGQLTVEQLDNLYHVMGVNK
jgi:3-dehydroquinate dehydratase I